MQHKQGIRTALFTGAAALGMAVSSAGVAWAISPSTAPPALQTAQVSQMTSQDNGGTAVVTPKMIDSETVVETSDLTGAADTSETTGPSTSNDAAESTETVSSSNTTGAVDTSETVETPDSTGTADTSETVGASTSNDVAEDESQTSDVQEPSYESSITAPQDEGQSDADEAAALEALATITPDQAREAALAAVPGTAGTVELDNENGAVVYSVEISDLSGSIIDVKVDAGDGTILSQQASHSDEASDQSDGPDNDNTQDESESDNDVADPVDD